MSLGDDPKAHLRALAHISDASDELHRAAKPHRTKETIRVNATIALFEMESSR